MKPKILYLCPNGYLGGAERFVLEANLIHLSQDLESEILFFSDGVAVTKAKEYGIKCRVLENQFKFSKPLQLFRSLKEINKMVIEENFSIVHSTMPYTHIISSLAFYFHPVKTVWFQHGPLGNVFDYIAPFFKSDALLFNTQYLKNDHENKLFQYFIPQFEKIVPYSINEDLPEPNKVVEIQNKLGSEKLRILLLGRICPWKGYETAIMAIKRIISNHPMKELIKVSVVGDVGRSEDIPYFDKVKALLSENNLEENFTFWGQQNNPQNFMGAHHVFLHTSNIPEPFGLVVGEAMLSGALCVGSSVGGTPEMIIHGQTGFGFDTTDKNADDLLFPILDNIVNDFSKGRFEKSYGDLIKKGQNHIQQNFSRERLGRDLNDLYRKLLNL
ncbi:glycosyltransferase family 4 protein [Bacteriovoracaceae bacterium]|nr:glycosyltransferase family 4 protein [Bacteriovoracaceae bacterium]MDC1174868.1 glycosyltransferase family 4 protein [Bacteriovoracaceae bacterium]